MITIRTLSGHRLDLDALQPEDITLEDLARGLSHTCRFAGHLPDFYSVAQHCVLVADLVPVHLRLHALLHDGSEAFMGDLSRDLKHHPLLAGYREIEAHVQYAIERRFQLRPLTAIERDLLKVADDVAATYESTVIRSAQPWSVMALAGERFRLPMEAVLTVVQKLPPVWKAWPAPVAADLWTRLVIAEMRKATATVN